MAAVIDAKYATLIGTPGQLQKLFGLLRRQGASVVDLKFCNLVVLDKPLDNTAIGRALESTPRRQR